MKKIGLLFGRENIFPNAIIEYINNKKLKTIKAEAIKLGALKMGDEINYHVIFDRISQAVPFYKSILKIASLNGTKVINDPSRDCADDNFFHTAIANKIGINIPETVILPSKDLPEGITHESLGNLIYPLDWDTVFDYVGFPSVLKACKGSSSYGDFKIFNPSEFFSAYDMTGKKVMIFQKLIDYEQYYRCYVVGKEKAKLMEYDPTKPIHLRYSQEETQVNPELEKELTSIAQNICQVLGTDFNAIEFAIKDGKPYVIEFLNSSPNTDKNLINDFNFEWLVESTGDFLIEMAKQKKSPHKILKEGKIL